MKASAGAPLLFSVMSKSAQSYDNRKHVLSEKTKVLAAAALAEKVGYLQLDDLPDKAVFQQLPERVYSAHRIIRCDRELVVIKEGKVELWQTNQDILVKEMGEGAIFGEMKLLGQTMMGTRAIVGAGGAKVGVMDEERAREWIKRDGEWIVEKLGERLTETEAQHYRRSFQMADARVAAELLEIAGEGESVEGVTHEELARRIGVYRETVTNVLDEMKSERIIEVGRKRVRILNRRALGELSEL
jgi:CRP/FNR family cyclic AMP-dependent transcriptional regulator